MMKDHKEYINKLRYDFSIGTLDESVVDVNAIVQFEKWFEDAVNAKVPDANAMVLSTATSDGKPSARVLLLRNFNESGFVFYSNYHSKKSMDMEQNPFAAITFFWQSLQRQVRIEGIVEKQSAAESDIYFNSRPRGSKMGAWVSPQSNVIPGRSYIDDKLAEFEKKFPDDNIPRPAYWGGFLLKPTSIEFWQGRPSRLHDRLLYVLQSDNTWKIQRLAP